MIDEFTPGTSTVICAYDRPIQMKTERVYGQLVWFRGVPVPLISEEDARLYERAAPATTWRVKHAKLHLQRKTYEGEVRF